MLSPCMNNCLGDNMHRVKNLVLGWLFASLPVQKGLSSCKSTGGRVWVMCLKEEQSNEN